MGLNRKEKEELNQIMRSHTDYETRKYAHIILMRDRDYSIKQLANIFDKPDSEIEIIIKKWKDTGGF